ncbi:hypothetical protein LJC46_09705 [Desulfovibrio sp. OttesenSCG-928-G15]|nr:hypothetical protein [Desulfovibrio sp. OttesenSCG-928-G15]
MINTKPPVSVNGNAANIRQTARKSAGKSVRATENFASYLKEGGAQGVRSGNATAVQGSKKASLLPLSMPLNGSQKLPGFVPDAKPQRSARQKSVAPMTQEQIAKAVAAPSGKKRRTSAKKQTGPNMQEIRQNFSRTRSSKHKSKKSPTRASGAPVTGNRNIGMSRTGKKGSGKSAMATRQAMDITAAQAQALKTERNGATSGGAPSEANAAYERYTALMGGYTGNLSNQNIATHGFSGKQGSEALQRLGYTPGENRSIRTTAQRLESDPYGIKDLRSAPPGTTFGSTRSITRPGLEEAAITAIHTNSHRRKNDALPSFGTTGKSVLDSFYKSANISLGSLAAKFESGNDGIAAIGYDRKGGTSYGKYQIASRVGTMNNFIEYLDGNAPDIAKRLRNAGPANTGGRHGRMPTEWRKIAEENPTRFEQLQADFIRSSHFEPAKDAIAEATGVSLDKLPAAIQEVLFSTAVQHGPSATTRIVSQAVKRVGTQKLQGIMETKGRSAKKAGEQLITQIYNLRAKQFASSTPQVRTAVRNRLRMEMHEAIQMLA